MGDAVDGGGPSLPSSLDCGDCVNTSAGGARWGGSVRAAAEGPSLLPSSSVVVVDGDCTQRQWQFHPTWPHCRELPVIALNLPWLILVE